MNNLFYAYNNDLTIKMEMEQRRREVDDIRLLHEAGLNNPSRIERFLVAVGSFLAGYGKMLRENHVRHHQAHQITSGKLAS